MKFFLAVFVTGFVLYANSSAAFVMSDGFSRTCTAPNWMTGKMEEVMETNVGPGKLGGFFATATSQPGGRWLIRWDVKRMLQLPADMQRFIFYHECAHARFGTSSEAIADCEGARMMKSDIGLNQAARATIQQVYAKYGRQFPPSGCQL